MSVSIIVGGQYGSEAKGKAAIAMASRVQGALLGVRTGGSNAGHTAFLGPNKTKYVLRMIPALVAIPHAELAICAGAQINQDLLLKEINEIERLGVSVRDRLWVDPHAVVVDDTAILYEREHGFGTNIGSTCTGTGATASSRALRSALLIKDTNIADNGWIRKPLIHKAIDDGDHVFVEGTQGFGLDLYHSGHYPFCTSQSTTAASFIMQAGISPFDVTDICMVIRTYPIRVGGNSGPMYKEITWEEVQRRCGAPEPLIEMTSVTKKVRRVGEFDWELMDRAVEYNKPSQIVIHGADYLNWLDRGCMDLEQLSPPSRYFIDLISSRYGIAVIMAFTGPAQEDVVEL